VGKKEAPTFLFRDPQPKISIVVSTARPSNWDFFIAGLGKNDVSYEVLLVGPNEGGFKLPSNFRCIVTSVKPVQCCEIGIRMARAPLFLHSADDMEFLRKGTSGVLEAADHLLDQLYEVYSALETDNVMLSTWLAVNRVDRSSQHYDLFKVQKAPCACLMSVENFINLGGYDVNFITSLGVMDLAMRVLQAGGSMVFSDLFGNENLGLGSSLYDRYGGRDRAFLESLWFRDGIFHLERSVPVVSFVDRGILRVTQGEKGEWT